METKERIIDTPWLDAMAVISSAVKDQMTAIKNDANLASKDKTVKVKALEKAWQRILVG